MAIKTWQENGKTFYSVRACARNKDRSVTVDRRASGSLDELDPVKYMPLIQQIERTLAIEAHQKLFLKEKSGVSWGDLIEKWEQDIFDNGTESHSKAARVDRFKLDFPII